jgi:integrase
VARTSVPFVAEAVEEFLRLKMARESATYRSYAGVLLGSDRGTKPSLGRALAPHFQNRRFNTVTHDEIAAWFGQRVRGGSQATKHRISKEARAFLRFARERGYTSLDLASAIDVFRPGAARKDWLGWADVHRLVGAIPEFRYRMAASWLFWTGCRIGEACSAQQRDLRWREEAGLYEWSVPETKTDVARRVWLPDHLKPYIESSRKQNSPHPDWPILWDCEGRGFGRTENPACSISPHTVNAALEHAAAAIGIHIQITAHVARHSYCTNWIKDQGSHELSMEKLSRQVGTSVEVLRKTYVHLDFDDDDWAHIKTLGSSGE